MTSGELPDCVIVSGMPGAGKTTVTRLAARLLPRAARVGGDDVNLMIGSGFVWFMGTPTDEARACQTVIDGRGSLSALTMMPGR